MSTPRKRRFVKRAATALASFVLLASGSVGSFLSLQWLDGSSLVKDDVMTMLVDTVYAPLGFYIDSDIPGGDMLGRTAFNVWRAAGARGHDPAGQSARDVSGI
jgi:hypothetical protein